MSEFIYRLIVSQDTKDIVYLNKILENMFTRRLKYLNTQYCSYNNTSNTHKSITALQSSKQPLLFTMYRNNLYFYISFKRHLSTFFGKWLFFI